MEIRILYIFTKIQKKRKFWKIHRIPNSRPIFMIFTLVESLEVEFFDGINLNSFNRVRFFQSGDKHQNIIFSTGFALPSGPGPSPGKYFEQIFFLRIKGIILMINLIYHKSKWEKWNLIYGTFTQLWEFSQNTFWARKG